MLNLVNSDLFNKWPSLGIVSVCTYSTAHRQYRLIMPLDLTLSSFLFAFKKEISFFQFISPTDARQTRVKLPGDFPFNLAEQE